MSDLPFDYEPDPDPTDDQDEMAAGCLVVLEILFWIVLAVGAACFVFWVIMEGLKHV